MSATVLLFILSGSRVAAQISMPKQAKQISQSVNDFTFKTFKNADNTFGYDIFNSGKKLIHQATIPGRSGTAGFRTEKDAEKVANMAIDKMKKGIMPPTIDEKELKNAGI